MPSESIFDTTYAGETVDFGNPTPGPQVDFSVEFSGVLEAFQGIGGGIPWGGIALALKLVFALIAVGSVVIAVYYYREHAKQRQVREEWIENYVHAHAPRRGASGGRWQRVASLFSSQHEGDWRLAIIEADAMLEDLMMQLGYQGNSLGERLKSADTVNFPHLQIAWQAHLVRNKIAHEGSQFRLSKVQAGRVMKWYETVFRQSGYIQ